MKTTGKKVVFILAAICLCVHLSFSLKDYFGKKKQGDLFLFNVEALAQGENEKNRYICYGLGSIDCPDGTKAAGYLSKYTLEF